MLRKCQRILSILTLLFFLGLNIFYSVNILENNKGVFNVKSSCRRSILRNISTSYIANDPMGISFVENSVLLGERKKRKGFLTVGYLHTEKCQNSKNLEKSLESLISFSKDANNEQLSIVVLLRDCSNADMYNFVKRMNSQFKILVQRKVLVIIKTPDELYVDTTPTGSDSPYWGTYKYNTQYFKESRAFTRDMAFLWKFSTTQSHYFIQFTDHVIVEEDITSFLLEYIKDKAAMSNWTWTEMLPGVLTGRVYNTKYFPELIEILNLFRNYLPANFILGKYHFFRYSSDFLTIPRTIIHDNYDFTGDNPSADIKTSLISVQEGHELQDIYKNRRGYFWADSPKVGDFIMIDFKSRVWIDRILIETGGRLYEDIIPGASLSVVFADGGENDNPDCYRTNYTKIADFPGAILALNGAKVFPELISCIKIVITKICPKQFRSWLIIRTLAVFQKS